LLSADDIGRKRVLDPGVAWIMVDMMKGVVNAGTGSAARINGVQVAGKTGTTSDEYDLWFDGYVPKYTASLWMGNDYNIKLSGMSGWAAGLWGRIMAQVPGVTEGSYKAMPSDVVKIGNEYYAKGTEKGRSTYFADLEKKEKEKKKKEEARKKREAAERAKKAAEKKAKEKAKKQKAKEKAKKEKAKKKEKEKKKKDD
jgi:penicillin-binding protein 1A